MKEKEFNTNIPELYYEKDIKSIEKNGWLIHGVLKDGKLDANYHTHGLKENFNHTDIQIVLLMRPERIQAIMNVIVGCILNGKSFEPDILYYDIFSMPLLFKKAVENNREVLRLIIPDEKGFFPNDPYVNPDYAIQFIGL